MSWDDFDERTKRRANVMLAAFLIVIVAIIVLGVLAAVHVVSWWVPVLIALAVASVGIILSTAEALADPTKPVGWRRGRIF